MLTLTPNCLTRLRLGIFGVGRMGLVHLEHLTRLARAGDIDLVAIGDRFPPTLAGARSMLERWHCTGDVRSFDTPDAMAEQCALDGCVVASQTQDHARDTLSFAGRGIRVMVEKPLAGSVDEAASLCAALGDSRKDLVQVAFQRHYDAAARAAMRWVADGWIGAIQQSHHVLQDKNPTPAGYQSSGITADMAIHLIFEAMAFHDFALPDRVQAMRFMAPHYEDRAREGANVVHAFCQWPDGSVAHLWGSRINNTGYDNGFKLIGTEGRIDVGEFIGDFGPIRAKLWTGTRDTGDRGYLRESLTFDMTPTSAGRPDFHARFASAYAAELDAFVRHAREGTACEPGLDIGWKTMLVSELAERSSREGGRPFRLALGDGSPIRSAADAAAFVAPPGSASPRWGQSKHYSATSARDQFPSE
jgi:myo-inositol 2-dehydrogenase/D-chiro-inositol 1-dehydrogenase